MRSEEAQERRKSFVKNFIYDYFRDAEKALGKIARKLGPLMPEEAAEATRLGEAVEALHKKVIG